MRPECLDEQELLVLNGDSITYSLHDHALQRDVKKESEVTATKIHNTLNNKEQFTLQIDISTDRIVIRGPGDQLIDEFKRVNPGAPMGKFSVRGDVALSILKIQ